VDQGALLKKKVNRPSAALLTWPKRFECSAFWGMMELLEIDGKTAPGKKPLEKSDEDDDAATALAEEKEEKKKPKHNLEEVSSMAKQKSFRLRESIVLQAMSGPAPAGLKDPKDRGGLDSLIFQAANRGRARQAPEDQPPEPAPARSPMPKRASAIKRDSMLAPSDMAAIASLTESLNRAQIPQLGAPQLGAPQLGGSSGGNSAADSVMAEVAAVRAKYEKETMKAKLNMAEKDAEKAKAEVEAAQARFAFAKTEVAMLKEVVSAYENAEKKLAAMK